MNLSETFQTAMGHVQQGDMDAALRVFGDILENQPAKMNAEMITFFGQVYNNIGAIEANRGNLKPALAAFREALDIAPGNIEALANLGIVQRKMGNLDGARETLEAVLASDPKHAKAALNLGTLLLELREMEPALNVLKAGAVHNPQNREIAETLATAFEMTGQFDDALIIRDLVCKAFPQSFEAFFSRGATYYFVQKFAEAIASYNEALKLRPNDPIVLMNLGICHLNSQNISQAEKNFKDALDANALLVDAAAHLSNIYYESGRHDEAKAMAEAHLTQAPDHMLMNLVLARLANDKGDGQGALSCLQRFEGADLNGPASVAVVVELGKAYHLSEQAEKAEGYFQKTREIVAQYPTLEFLLSRLPTQDKTQ